MNTLPVAQDGPKAKILPSLEDLSKDWGRQVILAILKAIPKRYKTAKMKVDDGIGDTYQGFCCVGTSVRDLETLIIVGFIVDAFDGTLTGDISWKEVGYSEQKTDLRLKANDSGDKAVELVLNVIQRNERA